MEGSGDLFARCDLHVHTYFSPCGEPEMTPAAIIRAAQAQGIEHLAITDHIHPYTDLAILDQVREELSRIGTGINLYVGCEADILAVGESIVDSVLAGKTDFVMVAANHFHDPLVSQPASEERRNVARHFLEMFTYAASLELVDVIAHPFFVMPDSHDPLAPSVLTENELLPAIELAAKNHISMEISRRALTPEQRPFLMSFYRLCKEAGMKFAIGNDAHRLEDVGGARLIEPLIRELGLTDEHIWLPESR